MRKTERLLEISGFIGMRRRELESLIHRMLQYLILDFAISKIKVESETYGQAPPSADQVHEWFRLGGCSFEQAPPVSGLSRFLSTYNTVKGRKRTSVSLGGNQGCAFVGGCAFEDVQTARRFDIDIEADHIIPFAKSRSDPIWQFQPLCRPHNLLKGSALFWTASEILPIGGWEP